MLEDLAKRPSDSESPKGIVLGSSFGRISIAKNKNNESVLLNLRLQHTGVSGELISFDVENESDGTLKMLHLAYALFQIRQGKNRIYVIDELDRCLHTRLSSLFLYMALQQEAENQVIVTTHDTNLINRELLRKDEIWVVDKDAFGASHLTSLAEFKTHADMPLEKAYMQGRFGGVPHIQDMDDLGLHIKGLEPTHVS
jgi:AAA15 family ATPase/GTPase